MRLQRDSTVLPAPGFCILTIEVNGRAGGDNISTDLLINAFGINLFDATLDYYLDLPIKINRSKDKSSSIAYLTAKSAGRVLKIDSPQNFANGDNIVKYHLSVKEGNVVRVPQSSDDRLGYVITVADTPCDAKVSAIEAVNSINIVLEAT